MMKMDLVAVKHNNNPFALDFINTVFIKFWGVPPLLLLTWFGDQLLLFITPGDIEPWLKMATTIGIGGILLLYTLRKKKREERHDEEKHRQELERQRQEMAQDKMDAWISQYHNALSAGIIKPETTLAAFIKQLETIEAASLTKSHKTR